MKLMRYLTALLAFYLLIGLAKAEIVDTYQFKNQDDRVRAVALAKSLRCPQCQNQNLVESNSPIAYDLRIEVYKMIDEGKTNQQIIDQLSARFGDFVRYDPPFKWTTALLWGLPFALLLIALISMWRYAKGREKISPKTTALSAEKQRAIADLLEKK